MSKGAGLEDNTPSPAPEGGLGFRQDPRKDFSGLLAKGMIINYPTPKTLNPKPCIGCRTVALNDFGDWKLNSETARV